MSAYTNQLDEVDHQRAVRGFYIHAAVFAIVNLILLAINLVKSPQVL